MIIKTNKHIASAYALSMIEAILEKPDIETLKSISETVKMLLGTFDWSEPTQEKYLEDLMMLERLTDKRIRDNSPVSFKDRLSEHYIGCLERIAIF